MGGFTPAPVTGINGGSLREWMVLPQLKPPTCGVSNISSQPGSLRLAIQNSWSSSF